MNIRHTPEMAERFMRDTAIVSGLLEYAEDYLSKDYPGLEVISFCCFQSYFDESRKEIITHCGGVNPLFPGNREERIRLCRKCRDWCHQKLAELRREVQNGREGQDFRSPSEALLSSR